MHCSSKKPLFRRLSSGLEQLETRALMATVPTGFLDNAVVSSLTDPTALVRANDGRFFITEQSGDVRVVKANQLLSEPFVSLNVVSDGERGLLGVALDPSFSTNRFVYVYYTVPGTTPHNRVSRFTANGDKATPGSEQVLLELDNLSSATNHNGGAIHFGKDGKLYVAAGDNANGANAQSLTTTHGKILRINPDPNNLIPADNPFIAQTTGKFQAIWALGLRNPYTFSVNPVLGKIFINDVGQSTWEEINEGKAGANYGWPDTEGPTTDPAFETPVFAYRHDGPQPSGNVITGGAFYNPANSKFPAQYRGDYFFTDGGAGWIWKYDVATDTATEFATGVSFPVDLHVGDDGNLYYLSRGTGELRRISFNNQPPVISGARTTSTFTEPLAPNDPRAIRIVPQATVSDATSPTLAGGQLTVKFTSGRQTSDRLAILADANLVLAGNQVRYKGRTIGTFSVSTTDGSLSVLFNGNASQFAASYVLRRVTFGNTSTDPTATRRVLQIQLTDGMGGRSTPLNHTVRVVPRANIVASSARTTSSPAATNSALLPLPGVISGWIDPRKETSPANSKPIASTDAALTAAYTWLDVIELPE